MQLVNLRPFEAPSHLTFGYSRWRHGGWYVCGVRYASGASGCVSRNYPDRKWRIICDRRRRGDIGEPGDYTYPSRDEAARAEYALSQMDRHFWPVAEKACQAFWDAYAEQVGQRVTDEVHLHNLDLSAIYLWLTGVEGPHTQGLFVTAGGFAEHYVNRLLDLVLRPAAEILRDARPDLPEVSEIVLIRLRNCIAHTLETDQVTPW